MQALFPQSLFPCKTAEQKNKINWEEREKELIELCDKYRSKDGSYDCLIPGSGGKDSFYQAHVLKYKYGMHPLTITWAPNIYTDWGWKILLLSSAVKYFQSLVALELSAMGLPYSASFSP